MEQHPLYSDENDYEDPEQQQKGMGYGDGYGFYQQQLQQGDQPDNQSQGGLLTGMQPLAHVMGMGTDGGTLINLQQQQHEGFYPSYLAGTVGQSKPDNQSQGGLLTGMQPLAQVIGMGADSINLQQQQHEGFHPSYLVEMGNSQYESAAIGHTQVETYQTVGNQPKASASSVQQYQPYQLQGNEHLQIQQKLSTTIVAAEKLLDPLNLALLNSYRPELFSELQHKIQPSFSTPVAAAETLLDPFNLSSVKNYRPELYSELLHKMRGIDSVYEDKNDSGMTLYQSNDTLNEFRRQGDEIMSRPNSVSLSRGHRSRDTLRKYRSSRQTRSLSALSQRTTYFKISTDNLLEMYGRLQPDSAYDLMKSQTSLGGQFYGKITYKALKKRWDRAKEEVGIDETMFMAAGSNNAIAVDTDPHNNDEDDAEFPFDDSDLQEQYGRMAVNCEQKQQ